MDTSEFILSQNRAKTSLLAKAMISLVIKNSYYMWIKFREDSSQSDSGRKGKFILAGVYPQRIKIDKKQDTFYIQFSSIETYHIFPVFTLH